MLKICKNKFIFCEFCAFSRIFFATNSSVFIFSSFLNTLINTVMSIRYYVFSCSHTFPKLYSFFSEMPEILVLLSFMTVFSVPLALYILMVLQYKEIINILCLAKEHHILLSTMLKILSFNKPLILIIRISPYPLRPNGRVNKTSWIARFGKCIVCSETAMPLKSPQLF